MTLVRCEACGVELPRVNIAVVLGPDADALLARCPRCIITWARMSPQADAMARALGEPCLEVERPRSGTEG